MNKPLKIILLVLAALVLLVVGYLAYVLIDYHRLGDMDLEVDRQALQPAETGREYHLLSYNIGFGAYEPDYGFFMDGGTESWAWSQERLTDNIGNIGSFLSAAACGLLSHPGGGPGFHPQLSCGRGRHAAVRAAGV